MRFLDVDAESRRALEFDAVLDGVAGHAATVMGGSAIRELRPAAEVEWIRAEIDAVGEVSRHLAEHGLPVADAPDPTDFTGQRNHSLCLVASRAIFSSMQTGPGEDKRSSKNPHPQAQILPESDALG